MGTRTVQKLVTPKAAASPVAHALRMTRPFAQDLEPATAAHAQGPGAHFSFGNISVRTPVSVHEKAPGDPPNGGAPAAGPVVKKKKAGVDSFTVDWSKGAGAGPNRIALHLGYAVRFTKDADHDPALAEFRQYAQTSYKITDGPGKGQEGGTPPLHDDHYSRADDHQHALADVDFASDDNPDMEGIRADDVVSYSFTARQDIIDTSDGNKVIATRGPHTATVTGKDPRAYAGVPVKLE